MAAVVADSGNERDTLLPRRSDEESVIQFNRRERVAGYLESRITHSGVIVLICIDAICVLIDISYQLLSDQCGVSGGKAENPYFLEVLSHISLIITSLFLVEIPLALYAFGLAYYYKGLHWLLHSLDALVVLVTFTLEVFLRGKESEVAGLLVLLRLWRLIKLVEGVAVGVGEWDAAPQLRKVQQIDINGRHWTADELAKYIGSLQSEVEQSRVA